MQGMVLYVQPSTNTWLQDKAAIHTNKKRMCQAHPLLICIIVSHRFLMKTLRPFTM